MCIQITESEPSTGHCRYINYQNKGLGSRRGEIGPAIEMHTKLKYVYMVYFIEKNQNFICLVLKLSKLLISKDKDPL